MGTGYSIHVGVEKTVGCTGSATSARGAHNDAEAMEDLARAQGFTHRTLIIGGAATLSAFTSAVRGLGSLTEDDFLLLTFTGHGCRTQERPCTEVDCALDSWCLSDGVLYDKALIALLAGFAEKLRILVVSGSCYSGGMRNLKFAGRAPAPLRPVSSARMAVSSHSLSQPLPHPAADVKASVVFLMACDEPEIAQAATRKDECSLFTRILLQTWGAGAFPGDYVRFITDIRAGVQAERPEQTPIWSSTGLDPAFWTSQKPFTIEPPPAGIVTIPPPEQLTPARRRPRGVRSSVTNGRREP